MRGHEHIIAMRLRGTAPKFVFVNDWPCKTDWFEHADHATVCTHGDVVQLLDFRFLVGLRVSISATSEVRAKALLEQAKAAGARTVAACHVQPEKHPCEQTGWCEIFHKETEAIHA